VRHGHRPSLAAIPVAVKRRDTRLEAQPGRFCALDARPRVVGARPSALADHDRGSILNVGTEIVSLAGAINLDRLQSECVRQFGWQRRSGSEDERDDKGLFSSLEEARSQLMSDFGEFLVSDDRADDDHEDVE
jgi:hypothetical protein